MCIRDRLKSPHSGKTSISQCMFESFRRCSAFTNFRTCDPSLQQTRPQLYEKLNIDLLTWRTLITNALADMYGIVGEARHFDILAKQQKTPALDAVIRVMPEDKDVFITSLASYNFSLSDHLGQEYDVTASITVKNSSPYLGLLVTSELADL